MTNQPTAKEFASLIEKHTRKLLEGVSIQKKLTMCFMDLNREAIKLAQQELRETKICEKNKSDL